jgi:hypothetical protein
MLIKMIEIQRSGAIEWGSILLWTRLCNRLFPVCVGIHIGAKAMEKDYKEIELEAWDDFIQSLMSQTEEDFRLEMQQYYTDEADE